jgi:hypothetical protein
MKSQKIHEVLTASPNGYMVRGKTISGERLSMSFWSFLQKIFSLSGQDEAELDKLRAKHGIVVDEKLSVDKDKEKAEAYDVWEDIRNIRTNFYLGSWATKKFRPIGEEKLKKQLADLEKKREEEERTARGAGD